MPNRSTSRSSTCDAYPICRRLSALPSVAQAFGALLAERRGQQTANMAANGLDLSSGTPAALLVQTDYYGLEDQRTLATNIEREASGFGNRARLAGMQADGIDPWMSAGGSLLSNAGAVADRWYKYKG